MKILARKFHRRIIYFLALAFFTFNLLEAASLFKSDEYFWHHRNIFNSELLTTAEKSAIAEVQKHRCKAIIPLPYFNWGSDVYQRGEPDTQMLPALLYAYHARLPVIGSNMSRTSITESEASINLLYMHKGDKSPVLSPADTFLVMVRPEDKFLPMERKLVSKLTHTFNGPGFTGGYLSGVDLTERSGRNKGKVLFQHNKEFKGDFKNYETLYTLPGDSATSGNYKVSFFYEPQQKNWKHLSCHLIIIQSAPDFYEWKYILPVNAASGVEGSKIYFENSVRIEKGLRHDFQFKGHNTAVTRSLNSL